MTLELHDGIVTVVPLIQPSAKKQRRDSSALQANVPGSLGEPVPVRIEEIATRASAFLHADEESTENPCLALLWEDNQDDPQLKILEIEPGPENEPSLVELKTKAELRQADRLDKGVSHLIPVPQPYGGFLILGERSIAYTDSELHNFYPQSLGDSATIWSCWAKVDDTRWLLADDYGNLYFLMLVTRDGSMVRSWKLDELGQASKASCLVYLDEGFVFLGSHLGDSQVVRIQEGGVEVLQTFANIAPILDMQLMDLGRGSENAVQTGEFSTGQARLVSCSGAWQDGSIRSIRSGVGMEELGEIGDIPLITDMWGLSTTSSEHDILLASFATETRVFKFDADAGVEEIDSFCNIEFDRPTLLAANLPGQKLLQVSDSGLNVSDLESGMTVLSWKPADPSAKITAASVNASYVVLIESGRTAHVFQNSDSAVGPVVSRTFEANSQISDVTISQTSANICIVSFWQTASVAVLDLATLETRITQSLGVPAVDVPRAILLGRLLPGSAQTLLISMADGSVVTFAFDLATLSFSNMTRIQLGSEPVFLKALPRSVDTEHDVINVFASCEQPSLIYASEGRIIYSAINSHQAARVCPFDSAAYPGAIAVASAENLRLAMIDKTRTTQLQTLPMGATVRCLAYHSDLRLFGMGTVTRTLDTDDDYPHEVLHSHVKLVDEVTFKDIDTFRLDDRELVECIASFQQPQSTEDVIEAEEEDCFFIVGTSTAPEEGSYSQEDRGRILVFSVNSRRPKLNLVTQASVRGACRSVATGDGLIIAGLVKVVVLYSLAPGSGRGESHTLKRLTSYRTSTNPISLSVQLSTESRPMTVAVGDLMKSVSVVEVRPPEDTAGWEMIESARHFATLWTSAVAAVADREWAVADMEGNLAMLRQNPEAYGDEALRLEVTGEMRLSEVVNKIVPIPGSEAPSAGKATPSNKGKERTGSMISRVRTTSVAEDVGPLISPQAFIATVEGSIYMLGSINPVYTDALLRVQSCLATRVLAPGYMPWSKYRAWSTEVREGDEPFRFVDGEMVERGLLNLPDNQLEEVLRESGLNEQNLTLEKLRAWGEDLRRLY